VPLLHDRHIAFVSLQSYGFYHPEASSKQGGAEVQVALLARILAENHGAKVRVVCLGPENRLERHGPVELAVLSRETNASQKVRAVLESLSDFQTDCVLQMSWGIETWMAARYASRRKKRFIFLIAQTEDVRLGLKDWLHWRRALYRRGLRAADRIIAQSDEQVQSLPPPLRPKTAIIKSVQPSPEDLFPEKTNILWVGRAVPLKQAEVFLDLAERLPGLPFEIILNPTHEEEYSRRLAERADALPNVKRIPYVPYDSILDHFRRARLFVSTSTVEGFPNTFLQAFRTRTPVFTLQADPDGVIARFGLGFCASGNRETLACQIENRYTDAAWLRETGNHAAEYLTRNHAPRTVGDQWAEMIAATLQNS